jgi:type IV pilus assembly protein PilY1
MKRSSAFIVAVMLTLPGAAWAQAVLNIQDDFTQAAAQNNWVTYDGACLTAGNGSGSIPACVGLPYYQTQGAQTWVGGTNGTLPDAAGSGALRLTNGCGAGNCDGSFTHGFKQAGGIVSNFTFNAGTGVNVIFKTVTYTGDSGGAGGDGADGMSFFLTDASNPYDMGAFGGSLGYTCSNVNNDPTLRGDLTPRAFDGLRRGYIGLGIDEYGNFLNQGDNTATGYGYLPGRIGLRGAGSIAWYSLNNNAATSAYYPVSLTPAQRAQAVQNTCRTGHIWDYTNSTPSDTGIALADYAPIPNAFKILPGGAPIANEAATKRSQAVPIAYSLKITQNGLLSLSYSYNGGAYQPVITKQDITAGNGPLPVALRFGFAGSTGGSTNIHEILCFQANPADLAATSVGVNEKEASKIASGTQAFLAFYFPNDWTGSLTANNLLFNPVTNVISVQTTANWDASCNLTGSASCTNTGGAAVAVQGPISRTMLTWSGAAGVPLEWGSLSAAQQNALNLGDAQGQKRLAYLRGDRTNEINTAGLGLFRARDSVLGDIVDSSPTWVGPPNNPYTLVWKDRQYPAAVPPENGASSYTNFLAGTGSYATAAQTRTNVVYTGANDGVLHGFRAGSFDASNNFVSTVNDGKEVLAFMPNTVLQAIHQFSLVNPTAVALDYSNPQYAHSFYVDATPAEDDLYYAGAWHTWVVGGLGAGGSALYALDVTNPANFSEAAGAAAATVIGEWTPATITCVHVTNVANCANSLGNTYGVPVIRRLHSGNWAVIFGNGYGSVTGDAGIFIMMVDAVSGARSFYYIGTGAKGTAATCAPAAPPCNGIASPAPADLDGDHITDYVYAGDLLGNVWRFDLTSNNPANWAASATPLFTDPSGHPITTKLQLVSSPMGAGLPRVMIAFGTGRKFPLTNSTPQSYVGGTHNLYGIWDWNMTAWNSASAVQYASLSPGPASVGLANLLQQTLTPVANTVLEDTNNPVCWPGLPGCAATPQYGWYITLPGVNEQVVFNPLVYLNALFVNTIIPVNNSLLSCKTLTDTGNTIGISVSSGGVIPGFYPTYADTLAVGNQTNASGSPFIVQAGGQTQMLTQTIGNLPAGDTGPISCPPGSAVCHVPFKAQGPTGKRLTWIERR